jgi:hypothetical protein
MNCELELVEKYLKKEFPYVVKIKSLVESPPVITYSGVTFTSQTFDMKIFIKDSFFSQLENNGPLSNTILTSFTKECAQIVKSICPELDISSELLRVLFISETEI